MKKIFPIFLFAYSVSASAIEANVAYAGVRGNGGMFIQLTTTYQLDGCSSPELWVDANHPAKRDILSVALAAVASGKQIGVVITQCSAPGGRPLFTTDTGSYIYLKN